MVIIVYIFLFGFSEMPLGNGVDQVKLNVNILYIRRKMKYSLCQMFLGIIWKVKYSSGFNQKTRKCCTWMCANFYSKKLPVVRSLKYNTSILHIRSYKGRPHQEWWQIEFFVRFQYKFNGYSLTKPNKQLTCLYK